jgi:hypothetical protein
MNLALILGSSLALIFPFSMAYDTSSSKGAPLA